MRIIQDPAYKALLDLSSRPFFAATHLLAERARFNKDMPIKYVISVISTSDPQFSEYPLLAFSLFKLVLAEKESISKDKSYVALYKKINDNVVQWRKELEIQACPLARDVLLHESVQEKFGCFNLRKIGGGKC